MTYTLTVYFCGKEKTVVQGVTQTELDGLAGAVTENRILSLHKPNGKAVHVPTWNLDYYESEVEAEEEEST